MRINTALVAPYVAAMNAAATAGERKAVVAEICRMFAISKASVYKALEAEGWESGRKTRKDAGSTSADMQTLTIIAAMSKKGIRKNGKSTMPVNVSASVTEMNGKPVGVSNSRLRQLLREKELSEKSMKAPTPHQRMRSLHPNHVHCIDPSLCLIYFAPQGGQRILRDDEVYKNKPWLAGKEDLKCWRYVLTDHYSSTICVRYYAAAGEKQENLYDFLLYAWAKKQARSYVFHGVPEMIVWDKGSANMSRAIKNALVALRVKHWEHAAGNPRAKGQVENANNLVETHFECLLKLEEVESIEALNDAAERWCEAYNADQIPGQDTRLRRMGRIIGERTWLWQRIAKEQLRELPPEDVCRQIFTTGMVARKVAGDLTIRVAHPKVKGALVYSVANLPDILAGQEVLVQPVLVDPQPLIAVMLKNGKDLTAYEVEPLQVDAAGFDIQAAVLGQEYKAQKDTRRERNAKELDALSGEGTKSVPFAAVTGGAGFKTHSLIQPEGSPFIRQSTGAQIEVAQTIHTHEIVISAVEAAKRLRAQGIDLEDGFIDNLRAQYPEGVSTRVVDDLIKQRKPKVEQPINTKGWVIEGGAASGHEIAKTHPEERQSKIA